MTNLSTPNPSTTPKITLENCSLYTFMQCLNNRQYNLLWDNSQPIDKEPIDEIINARQTLKMFRSPMHKWLGLLGPYLEAIDFKDNGLVDILKQLTHTVLSISVDNTCCKMLTIINDEYYAETLRERYPIYKFTYDSAENDIKNLLPTIEKKILKYNRLCAQYELYRPSISERQVRKDIDEMKVAGVYGITTYELQTGTGGDYYTAIPRLPTSRATTEKPALMKKNRHKIHAQPAQQACTYITELTELPLMAFIRCTCKADYSGLHKGTPNKQRLQSVWFDLLNQFYEAKADKNVTSELENASELMELQLRKRFYEMALSILRLRYDDDLIEILREQGHDYEYSKEDYESYYKDLQSVENMERNNWNELARLQKQYDEMVASKQGASKTTEVDFYKSLASMNELWHTSYNIHELDTMQYAILCSRYSEYVENMTIKRDINAYT